MIQWLRAILQTVSFLQLGKYWRVGLGAFAVFLALAGIIFGSTATIILAAFLGFLAIAKDVL